MRKELGKINSAEFMVEDGRVGFVFELGGEGWGVCSAHVTYEQSASKNLYNHCYVVMQYLKDAKKRKLSELVGKPIEACFEGNILQSFRILTEVL